MKAGFISLGCSKNLVDTEVMLGELKAHGIELTNEPQEADILIVNTCAFIQSAKEESITTVLNMADYKESGRCRSLIVAGCLGQRYKQELLDELLAFVADGQHSVLLSSHITSDLDRTADRVICIDNGSIVFDLPREDITDRAGIAHCTQAQAAELMACVEGARAVHHAYSVDVLVPNRRETLEAFPEIPCDRATIDDYLRLMLKGASK